MTLRDNLTNDAVETLRQLDPTELSSRGTVGEAIALMQDRNEGYVVITEDARPVGMLTERDILRKVLPEKLPFDTPVAELMTSSPVVVSEDDSVAHIIGTMHAGGFRHVPVVDAGGRLKSVVSVKRIVEYLVDHFPNAVFNLPPKPGQVQAAREGA